MDKMYKYHMLNNIGLFVLKMYLCYFFHNKIWNIIKATDITMQANLQFNGSQF